MNKPILAVDIGGSKLMTALLHPEGREDALAEPRGLVRKELSRDIGQSGLLRVLAEAAGQTLALCGLTPDGIRGIGVTIPGLADPEEGVWVYAP